jgi:predicted transcriptional regulator
MVDIQKPTWLKDAMEEAGIKTGELSVRAGVSRSQIQRILNGMHPRLDTLRRITAVLEDTKRSPARRQAAA